MHANWCRETTTTTGTGSLTVAAATGYPRISASLPLKKRFSYAILLDSDGTPIECGIGYLSATSTLVREKVLATYVSGTLDISSPSAVSLASGTKRVIVTPLAQSIGPVLPYVGSGAGEKSIANGAVVGQYASDYYDSMDTSGRMNVHPWLHEYGGEVDAFMTHVTTAQSSKILRIGLYEVGSNGNPGDLLLSSGSIDLSSTGAKTSTFTATALPPGWYYIGLLSDSTTARLSGTGVAYGSYVHSQPWGNQMPAVGLGGYALSLSTSALPDPCPSLSLTGNLRNPYVALRSV